MSGFTSKGRRSTGRVFSLALFKGCYVTRLNELFNRGVVVVVVAAVGWRGEGVGGHQSEPFCLTG